MVKENTVLENSEVLLDQIEVSVGRLSPTSILVTIVTCFLTESTWITRTFQTILWMFQLEVQQKYQISI